MSVTMRRISGSLAWQWLHAPGVALVAGERVGRPGALEGDGRCLPACGHPPGVKRQGVLSSE